MLNDLGRLFEGVILVIVDVVGLYLYIFYDEGLRVLREVLIKFLNIFVLVDDLVDLVELVLKNNNFIFNGKYYF